MERSHLLIHLSQAFHHQAEVQRCEFTIITPLQAGATQTVAGAGPMDGVRHGGPPFLLLPLSPLRPDRRCPHMGAIQRSAATPAVIAEPCCRHRFSPAHAGSRFSLGAAATAPASHPTAGLDQQRPLLRPEHGDARRWRQLAGRAAGPVGRRAARPSEQQRLRGAGGGRGGRARLLAPRRSGAATSSCCAWNWNGSAVSIRPW